MLTLIARLIGRSVVMCLVLAVLVSAAPPDSRPRFENLVPSTRVYRATWMMRQTQIHARQFVRTVDGLVMQVWEVPLPMRLE